jgi:hypothetical protein
MNSALSPLAESPTSIAAPNQYDLVAQTRAFAEETYQAVAKAYLAFRREHYHEPEPDLATLPPAHAEIRKSELALLSESTLRLTPKAVTSIPLVGGFVKHLERVADMRSISEDERTALHNLTIGFLHGIHGGVQPWYVEWLFNSARNLSQINDLDYYLDFPYDGLLYRDPVSLAAFETAVRTSDVAALQREIKRLAVDLIEALHDPVRAQSRLAFTGPDGDHRRLMFELETAAGIALLTYLAANEVRKLVRPRQPHTAHSALAPLPTELQSRLGV